MKHGKLKLDDTANTYQGKAKDNLVPAKEEKKHIRKKSRNERLNEHFYEKVLSL